MSNIDRAFQNMPRLMGMNNNFMQTQQMPYQQQQQFFQTNQFMGGTMQFNQQQFPSQTGTMMYQQPSQMGTVQFHNPYQQQPQQFQMTGGLQQQQYLQQQNLMNTQQTLKLNQQAYYPNDQLNNKKFMQTDPRTDGVEERQKTNKILPNFLLKENAKQKQTNFEKQREEALNDPDAKKLLLEDSFDEDDFKDQIPLCSKQPKLEAIQFKKQQEEELKRMKQQEEFKKSETVYRALGKQQNNINEILFNAEEVAEQKKKTQQVMMNGLQVEIDKLEEEANRFENEMKDADNYIEEIGNDASEMGKILEKIKYQRQADRIMKKIDNAVDLNEDDMDEVKAEDLYRDLTTAEINEKLEKMYEKNQQLYDQVNNIMSELQNEGFNFENEDNNLNNESLRDSVYMENYQRLIELKKQHKKVGNTLNKNKQTIHTIKYPKYQNNSKKNSKKQSKQQGQKRVFNPDNLTKSKDIVAPKPIYTTSMYKKY